MIKREELEIKEEELLAPYAMKSRYTKGRVHKEPEHEFRMVYQRDKDRIVHSTAFRRLEYKTQVFVNHEGDYYRTRLTHTLEVVQIAKSIARAMRLNEDLVETIALAHDIGHPPFGHAGEEALQSIMQDHGGFNHNIQGLRVVDLLEERYPHFKGLNLNWEVREGIAKHVTSFDKQGLCSVQLEPDSHPSLEAQVVDVADEIAYDTHDLDDGITSNLFDDEKLNKIELWHSISAGLVSINPGLSKEIIKYQIVRTLIDMQVKDLIINSELNIKKYGISNFSEVKKCEIRPISFSEKMKEEKKPLKDFLMSNLYSHYKVVRMSDKAKRFIKELFEVYISKPEQLPYNTQKRINCEDSYRAVCDYIAGMTDRYALEEYKKLFDPFEKV